MDKKRIHEMLEKMTEWTLSEMQSKGKENVDTKEMGDAVDMVKDLAEAEMYVWKKCYYESIVEAMEKSDKEDELMLKMMIEEHGEAEGRAGYDRWRNSKGRFAPKGTGHETSMRTATGHGYTPNSPYYDDPRQWGEPWMGVAGYDGNAPRRNDGRTSGSSYEQSHAAGRMGYTPGRDIQSMTGKGDRYDMYDEARRHFHESGDQQSKQQMSEKAREYVDETVTTIRDMFIESDPEMQKKIRDDLSRLYREFGGK